MSDKKKGRRGEGLNKWMKMDCRLHHASLVRKKVTAPELHESASTAEYPPDHHGPARTHLSTYWHSHIVDQRGRYQIRMMPMIDILIFGSDPLQRSHVALMRERMV